MSKKKYLNRKKIREMEVSMADMEDQIHYPYGWHHDYFWDYDEYPFWHGRHNWSIWPDPNLDDDSMQRKYDWPKNTSELSLVKMLNFLKKLKLKSIE